MQTTLLTDLLIDGAVLDAELWPRVEKCLQLKAGSIAGCEALRRQVRAATDDARKEVAAEVAWRKRGDVAAPLECACGATGSA